MIYYGRQYIDEEDIQAVVDCLRSQHITQGPIIAKFENAIAKYVGSRFAVAVSSGTAALHLAAIAAKISPGKALLTSPITFVATPNSALYAGGTPLFADIDRDTLNISPIEIEKMLNKHKNIEVISPVHFAGLCCDMIAINKLANKYNALIVEDAAHALGSRYEDGSFVGNCKYSLMTVFSFHPVKSITTGEGGLITTNSEKVYRHLLRLRSHGINKQDDNFLNEKNAFTDGISNPWYYEMQELGYHYRITDIQCALGLSQIKKLDFFIEKRKILAKRYDKAFSEFKNIKPAQISGRNNSSHHLYPVRINFTSGRITRANLMNKLRQKGIITQVHYIPVTMQPYYNSLGHDSKNFPAAISFYDQGLSLPLYVDLKEEDQGFVIETLRSYLE